MNAPHCCIVGAGPGISAAVAEAFTRDGCNVSLLARRPERLKPLVQDLQKKSGRTACALGCNASDETDLRGAIAQAESMLGPTQVLVYNVAASETGRPSGLSGDQLVADFRANVVGALAAAQAVTPGMRDMRRGTILFTGGGFAYEPAHNYASLSLGKAALRNLTYSLAQELGVYGIHVATVTVYGFIQSGTHFDPKRIAQTFLDLHHQPKGHFEIEKVFK